MFLTHLITFTNLIYYSTIQTLNPNNLAFLLFMKIVPSLHFSFCWLCSTVSRHPIANDISRHTHQSQNLQKFSSSSNSVLVAICLKVAWYRRLNHNLAYNAFDRLLRPRLVSKQVELLMRLVTLLPIYFS